jgi:3-phenylpropionate/trans-cinnamate dioxygenase ferredoxin subunit
MSRHVVAPAADLPPGSRKLVTIRGRPIVIFNIDGELFGLLNTCPHQGGNLSAGKLTGLVESRKPGQYLRSREGEILRCPWHGWEYDVRTGKSWCEPNRIGVRKFSVDVRPGTQLVEGPYVAETFPVSIDENYVVVEV